MLRDLLDSILEQDHGPIFVSCDLSENSIHIEKFLSDLRKESFIKDFRIAPIHEGLKHAVKNGIDWFFEQNESGWIFEDDLIVFQNTLKFAEGALEYCRNNENIHSVNLYNTVQSKNNDEKNWRISLLSSSHGWGTTRHNWMSFSKNYCGTNYADLLRVYAKKFGYVAGLAEISRIKVSSQKSWCVHWHSHILIKKGIVLQSNRALIGNRGNDISSTHKRQRLPFLETREKQIGLLPEIDDTDFEVLGESNEILKKDKKRIEIEFGNDLPHLMYRMLKIFILMSTRRVEKLRTTNDK